jgi:hypothetical protein
MIQIKNTPAPIWDQGNTVGTSTCYGLEALGSILVTEMSTKRCVLGGGGALSSNSGSLNLWQL